MRGRFVFDHVFKFMCIMNYILHCLIWVILTSTTAYKCKQHNDFYYPGPLFGYPHYHEDYHEYRHEAYHEYESFRPTPQTRRVDNDNNRRYYNQDNNERISERSAEISNERPTQRMSERSIAVNTNIQRVQEQERRRLQSRVEDSLPRTENGSYKIVNHYPKPYPSVTNRRGQIEEEMQNFRDSVVFPGPTSKSSYSLEPEISDECKSIGICEDVPNYPQDLADKIVVELGDKVKMLNVDELDNSIEIAQRIGPAQENIELCSFRERIMNPRAGQDKNGEWHFILNREDNPLQGYRVEICISKGVTCAESIARFYDSYTATCRQKYVQRTVVVIDKKTGKSREKHLKLPSCCSCVASSNGKK